MPFLWFQAESTRLKQEVGLGHWASRPLEYRGDNNGTTQPTQGTATVRDTRTFSQRLQAKKDTVPEAARPEGGECQGDTRPSSPEVADTNCTRPGDNLSLCPRQEPTGGSDKPKQQPFSSRYFGQRQAVLVESDTRISLCK